MHHIGLTLHIQQLVLGGYLRCGFSGAVSFAIISTLVFWTWVLNNKTLGRIVRDLRPVHGDFFGRNFPMQGHFVFRVGHPTRYSGGPVGTQVGDLKMDGGWNKQLIFV